MANKNTLKNTSLITSALSLILITSSSTAATAEKEQCAGIIKAGLSDCASAEHVCAGMNTDDGNETDWLWLPTGTCNKIVGAHTLKMDEANKSEETAKKS